MNATPIPEMSDDVRRLLEGARHLNKPALARLVSLFEDQRPSVAQQRHAVIKVLDVAQAQQPVARILGFTGTPGAGKSTLIAELCKHLLARNAGIRIAVLAVDPSSHISGGSILGDRTRLRISAHGERLFFRSQASNLELGGITQATYQATRVLRYFFDIIIIETVGIGQNEIDIQRIADHTFLVMQPLAGDQIQFMKCGIMEIPDSFIINKCDEATLAKSSYYLLRSALKQARLVDMRAQDDITRSHEDRIFLVSALKQTGITPLADTILDMPRVPLTHQKDEYYLERAIRRDFGEFGAAVLNSVRDGFTPDMTFEEKADRSYAAIHDRLI